MRKTQISFPSNLAITLILLNTLFWGFSLWQFSTSVLPSINSVESLYEEIIVVWDDDNSGVNYETKITETLDKLHDVTGELEKGFIVVHWLRFVSLVNFVSSPFHFAINNEFYAIVSYLRDLQNQIRLFSESIGVVSLMVDGFFDSIEEDRNYLEALILQTDRLSVELDILIKNGELLDESLSKSLNSYRSSSIILFVWPNKDTWMVLHEDLSKVLRFGTESLESLQTMVGLLGIYSSLEDDLKVESRIHKDDLTKANDLFVDLADRSGNLARANVHLNEGNPSRLSSEYIELIEDVASLVHEFSVVSNLAMGLLIERFDVIYEAQNEYLYTNDLKFFSEYLTEIYDKNSIFDSHFSNIETRLKNLSAGVEDLYGLSNDNAIILGLESSINYVNDAQLLTDSIPVFQYLLEDEVRHYLLLSHSADELRPTGGFVSGLWLMTLKGGNIEEIKYYDIVDVDDMSMINDYPNVPDLLRKYMGARIWLMRDVSWGPDIKTTAAAAQKMFEISTNQQIDGVIGVNQRVLFNLVESLGELEESGEYGGDVDSKEVISYIEKRSDESGRVFADSMFKSLLSQLGEYKSTGEILSIGDSMKRSVDSNDLWIYFFDHEIQTVLEQLDLYPILQRTSGDYLFIIDSNVGWSKSDSNIRRNFSYKIDLRNVARPSVDLELNYKNFSGNTAAECEPQWIDRGDSYSQLKNACHWNLVRIFMPAGARLMESSRFELPLLSIPVKKWDYEPGFDSADIGRFNEGLDQFSGLTIIGPGESISKTLKYELPDNTVQLNGNCASYHLELKKQPGISGRFGELIVLLPPGSTVSSYSEGMEVFDNKITVSLFVDKDSEIYLNLLLNQAIAC